MKYFFGILLACFFGTTAQAATLYMDPNNSFLNRGDAVKISVRLDTDEAAGECINAVDAVLTYSPSIIPVDISVGKSIFPIWVEQPVINKENRTITFAGGLPNGYCGRIQGDPNLTNNLVDIFFRAPGLQVGGDDSRSAASVQFGDETTVYLNDGQGTQVVPQKLGTTLTLGDSIGNEIIDPWRGDIQSDVIAPEPFSLSLEQNNTTFGGKYFIVFNTTDKQTGLSHYEVIEEGVEKNKLFDFGAATAPWIKAVSPFVLSDQSLHSTIRVKAVDKAGNEYIATLVPETSMQTFMFNELYVYAAIVALVIIFMTILVFVFLRHKRKMRLRMNEVNADVIVDEMNN